MQTLEKYKISDLQSRWRWYQGCSEQAIIILNDKIQQDRTETNQKELEFIQYQATFNFIVEISLTILWNLLNKNTTLNNELANLLTTLLNEVRLRPNEHQFLEELNNFVIQRQTGSINCIISSSQFLSNCSEDESLLTQTWKFPDTNNLSVELITNFIKTWNVNLEKINNLITPMFATIEDESQENTPCTPSKKTTNHLEAGGQPVVTSPSRIERIRPHSRKSSSGKKSELQNKVYQNASDILHNANAQETAAEESRYAELKERLVWTEQKFQEAKENASYLAKENLKLEQVEGLLDKTSQDLSWTESQLQASQEKSTSLEQAFQQETIKLRRAENSAVSFEKNLIWREKQLQEAQKSIASLTKEVTRLSNVENRVVEFEKNLIWREKQLQESEEKVTSLTNAAKQLEETLTHQLECLSLKNISLAKKVQSLKEETKSWEQKQTAWEMTNQHLNNQLADAVRILNPDTGEVIQDKELTDFTKELEYIKSERSRAQRLWSYEAEKLSQSEDTLQLFTSIIENLNDVVIEEQLKLDNQFTSCRQTIKNANDDTQAWQETLYKLQTYAQEVEELLEERKPSSTFQEENKTLPAKHREVVLSLQAMHEECIVLAKQYTRALGSEGAHQTKALRNNKALVDIEEYFNQFEEKLALKLDAVYSYLDILRNNISTQQFKWTRQMSIIMTLSLNYLVLNREVKSKIGLEERDDQPIKTPVYKLTKRATFILDHLPQLMSLKFAKVALDRLKKDFASCSATREFREDPMRLLCEQKIMLLEKKLAVPTEKDTIKHIPYIAKPWIVQSSDSGKVAYETFDMFESKPREFNWDAVKLVVSSASKIKAVQSATVNLYQQSDVTTQDNPRTKTVDLEKVIASLIQLILPYAEQDKNIVVTIEGNQNYVQILSNHLYASKALCQALSDANITIKTPQYEDIQQPSDEMLQTMNESIFGQHTFFSPSRMDSVHFTTPLILAQ